MGVMIPMKRERMLTIRVTDDTFRCPGNASAAKEHRERSELDE